MRTIRFVPALLLLLAACGTAPDPTTGATPSRSATLDLAGRAGDTVWVIVNTVRADRREQFERFIETFWRLGTDFGTRQDPLILRTFRRTRALRPIQQNPDGTWTYVFVMDPRVSGAEYDIATVLRRMVPADSANALFESFRSSLVGNQQAWLTVQALPHP